MTYTDNKLFQVIVKIKCTGNNNEYFIKINKKGLYHLFLLFIDEQILDYFY